MAQKKHLFSVTASDCVWEFIRGSGKGGQNRNKVSTAVRCRHPESGAIGFAQDSRSQLTNRRAAFRRMAESGQFKSWHKREVFRRLGRERVVADEVERKMQDRFICTEVRDEKGRWIMTQLIGN